ncbi:DUF6542 domain-containing protein [Williamsia deligens]|uniref:DUF6542 domain-containing protein n=1 Tax=Williamsia deligens TaxID=321325 RepID=A0ABW3G2W1_9NOCA|nr:DUF6542 domain-containing protein [Williamsia deligens]MCP2194913.1 hypothetical protein [Williamsia deligens]
MFSAPQSRAGVPTGRQSVVPTLRGVPWWGAVLIALVPAVVGALIDAGGAGDLSTWFRVLYFIGCVAAVLAVRRKALFTAVTQPPLVAFGVALVALYALEADASSGVKGLIINVMLPIAKTFPLMAWTFVVVGALGAARWFLTRGSESTTPQRSRHRPSNDARRTARSAGGRDRSAATSRRAESSRRTGTSRRTAEDAPRTTRRTPDDAPRPTRRTPEDTPRRAAADAPRRRGGDAPVRRAADTPPPRRSPDVPPRRAPAPRRTEDTLRSGEQDRIPGQARPYRAEPPVGRGVPGGAHRDGLDVPPVDRRSGAASAPRARYRGVNP